MSKSVIKFPSKIRLGKDQNIEIGDVDIRNVVSLNGIDYIPYYINPSFNKNKGGNSYILGLHQAQRFEEEGLNEPDLAMKILKFPITKYGNIKAQRFQNEIKALKDCKSRDLKNVIKLYDEGTCTINKVSYANKSIEQEFHFYTMEYAKFDLKAYLENETLSLYERVNLCMEIAYGLKELYSLGIYHRDLKPDNIFIIDGTWKIGDLGLIDRRDNNNSIDKVNEIIGPRGWFSPEVMNKYLTAGKESGYSFDCRIDHQSDIFQMGKVFWYILQGNAPIGCVKQEDFLVKDSGLFTILRTMLNHSKKRRYESIDEVIKLLKPIYNKYYKQ